MSPGHLISELVPVGSATSKAPKATAFSILFSAIITQAPSRGPGHVGQRVMDPGRPKVLGMCPSCHRLPSSTLQAGGRQPGPSLPRSSVFHVILSFPSSAHGCQMEWNCQCHQCSQESWLSWRHSWHNGKRTGQVSPSLGAHLKKEMKVPRGEHGDDGALSLLSLYLT